MKIFAHRKTFYENRPIIDRKFSDFPVAISIKQVKRHKSKGLIRFLQWSFREFFHCLLMFMQVKQKK